MKKSGTPGLHVKVGDEVTIIAGNDRGKIGKVTKSLPRQSKVVVEGINIKSKHIKGEDGGIVKIEHSINASNVKLASKQKIKAKKATTSRSKTKDDKAPKKTKKSNDKSNSSTDARDKETNK